MDFAAVISDLRAQLTAANARLANLGERRRPYALDAVTGDAAAKKAIEKIDADAAATRSEAETLAVAIEEAERRRAAHDARVAAEDRRRREAETRATCAAILAADREFDQIAKRLYQSLVDREGLVRKLASLGVIYPGVVNALRRRLNITSALAHAGLHEFAELRLGPPNFRKPLAELDGSLSNPIMTKAEGGDDPAAAPPAAPSDRMEIEEVHP